LAIKDILPKIDSFSPFGHHLPVEPVVGVSGIRKGIVTAEVITGLGVLEMSRLNQIKYEPTCVR